MLSETILDDSLFEELLKKLEEDILKEIEED